MATSDREAVVAALGDLAGVPPEPASIVRERLLLVDELDTPVADRLILD